MIPNQEYALNASAPTQIYPYGLQQTLTLKNTGTVDVYASPTPVLSGGLRIGKGRSVTWKAETPLYAYSSASGGQLLVVAADVTGQDVMEVNATITAGSVSISGGDINATIDGGTVNIGGVDTPVYVQSGGEILAEGTFGSIAQLAQSTINIPEPASGLAYQAVDVYITPSGSSIVTAWFWELKNSAGKTIANGTLVMPGSTYTKINSLNPLENVSAPAFGTYPYTLTVTNLSPGAGSEAGPYYRVTGKTVPVVTYDNVLTGNYGLPELSIAAASSFDVLLPPAHIPYWVSIYYPGRLAINVTASLFDPDFGGFVNVASNVMRAPVQPGGSEYRYLYPGGGRQARLTTASTFDTAITMRMEPLT